MGRRVALNVPVIAACDGGAVDSVPVAVNELTIASPKDVMVVVAPVASRNVSLQACDHARSAATTFSIASFASPNSIFVTGL
jgi:hypothetical protein